MEGKTRISGRFADFGTVIGLVGGVAFVLWAVAGGYDLRAFLHLPSFAMVLGGSICAGLVSFPLTDLRNLRRVLGVCFFESAESPEMVISQMVQLSEVARRDGVLALEDHSKTIDDPFTVAALQMTVDGVEPEQIQSILEAEIDAVEARHAQGRAFFENIGRYAPAFGMIGTLVGMVVMLHSMNNPAGIGPAMAIAMLTTFYGAAIANVVALPLADKLHRRTRSEIVRKTIIIRGIMAIQRGDNPRVVERKLSTFLPSATRGMAWGRRRAA